MRQWIWISIPCSGMCLWLLCCLCHFGLSIPFAGHYNREESRERRGASCEVSAVVKDPFPLCTHLKGVSSSADSLERLCQGPAEAQLLHAACSSGRMEKIQEGAHAGFIVAVPPLPFFDICPCQWRPAPFTGNWPQGDCLSLGNCICFLHLSPTHTHLFACQSVFALCRILSLRTALLFMALPPSSGHTAFPTCTLSLSFLRSFPKQWIETGSHLQLLFPFLSLKSIRAFYTVTLK